MPAGSRRSQGDMNRVRRWGLLVLGCVGAHVALLWWLEEPGPRAPAPVSFGSSIHLLADSWSAERLAGLPGAQDPAVFALPSIHGFSGATWLTFKPLRHEFTDTQIAQQWLELRAEDMGNYLADFFATNVFRPMRIADEPLPPLIGSTLRETFDLALPVSELRVSGALAARPMLNPPRLPAWPHTEILTNTVLQILVDGAGNALSCAMLSGCGLKEADTYAVKLASTIRFRAARAGNSQNRGSEPLVAGKLTFIWQTIAPTSAPPASAASGLTR